MLFLPFPEQKHKANQTVVMPNYVQHARSSLTQLAATGADARRIADRAVSMWSDVDAALSPIIGHRGVTALLRRSLLLTVPTHTALLTAHADVDAPSDFGALRATLERQSSETAIATNDALLQKFVDLLTNLIGESLTERLLRSVPDTPSSDGAVQETSS
ncbi:hypothetical protein [Povalibacter sp.]|uniref:hypothetical protein n=1 Tax=Povalibacter sp. TaxID=1962978 RepID=UPI002F40565C